MTFTIPQTSCFPVSTSPSLFLVKPSHQELISSSLKQIFATPEKPFHTILHRPCTVSKSSAPGKLGPTHSPSSTPEELDSSPSHVHSTWLPHPLYQGDWTLPFLPWASSAPTLSAPGHWTPPLPTWTLRGVILCTKKTESHPSGIWTPHGSCTLSSRKTRHHLSVRGYYMVPTLASLQTWVLVWLYRDKSTWIQLLELLYHLWALPRAAQCYP